jgi:hypothetical protein
MKQLHTSRAKVIATLVLLLAAMILAACGRREKKYVQDTLAQVDRTSLLAEARALWDRPRSSWPEEVPAAEWPRTIRRFGPEKVLVDRSGVFVCTHSVFVRDAGLFIALDQGFNAGGRTEPMFQRLDSVFYWFDAPG